MKELPSSINTETIVVEAITNKNKRVSQFSMHSSFSTNCSNRPFSSSTSSLTRRETITTHIPHTWTVYNSTHLPWKQERHVISCQTTKQGNGMRQFYDHESKQITPSYNTHVAQSNSGVLPPTNCKRDSVPFNFSVTECQKSYLGANQVTNKRPMRNDVGMQLSGNSCTLSNQYAQSQQSIRLVSTQTTQVSDRQRYHRSSHENKQYQDKHQTFYHKESPKYKQDKDIPSSTQILADTSLRAQNHFMRESLRTNKSNVNEKVFDEGTIRRNQCEENGRAMPHKLPPLQRNTSSDDGTIQCNPASVQVEIVHPSTHNSKSSFFSLCGAGRFQRRCRQKKPNPASSVGVASMQQQQPQQLRHPSRYHHHQLVIQDSNNPSEIQGSSQPNSSMMKNQHSHKKSLKQKQKYPSSIDDLNHGNSSAQENYLQRKNPTHASQLTHVFMQNTQTCSSSGLLARSLWWHYSGTVSPSLSVASSDVNALRCAAATIIQAHWRRYVVQRQMKYTMPRLFRLQHSRAAPAQQSLYPNATFIPGSVISERRVHERFEFFECIGTGTFATVMRCKRKGKAEVFALKCIPKDRIADSSSEELLKAEIRILQHISHKNIVKLHEVLETTTCVYLVLEYICGKDLFDMITTSGQLTELHTRNVARDLCSALEYLHAKEIVHRDIKPENIMAHTLSGRQPIIKLVDFGLATTITHPLRLVCGSPSYVAPEVVLKSKEGYSTPVDIWSTGIVLYVMFSGRLPFTIPSEYNDIHRSHYHQLSLNGREWHDVSMDGKKFLTSLLQFDPAKRTSSEKLLAQRWFRLPERSLSTRRRQTAVQSIKELVLSSKNGLVAGVKPKSEANNASIMNMSNCSQINAVLHELTEIEFVDEEPDGELLF